MQFETPLTPWTFEKRAKRFFMYGTGPDQVAHCPNTGSLKGILDRCARIWVRDHGENSGRTLRYTAEICELTNLSQNQDRMSEKGCFSRTAPQHTLEVCEERNAQKTTLCSQPSEGFGKDSTDGTMVAINTQRTNKLVMEAIGQGFIPAANGCENLRLEAKFSAETRFDLSFTQNGKLWWGEVKQTTLAEMRGGPDGASVMQARFPDAVTERGLKHLSTLTQIVQERHEGALQVYVSTRSDTTHFAPAEDIHPAYAKALAIAMQVGVSVVALGCQITPEAIIVDRQLPVVL